MCECNLIQESTFNSIKLDHKYSLIHKLPNLPPDILLEDFYLEGNINYAAIYKIKDTHQIKSGYMIILGEENDKI